jgi:hypothetical protein
MAHDRLACGGFAIFFGRPDRDGSVETVRTVARENAAGRTAPVAGTMMLRRVSRIGGVVAFVGAIVRLVPAAAPPAAPAPDESRLRTEVATLASPAMAGRRGEGARRAAEHLVTAFRELGLEPLFEGSYEQAVPGEEPGQVLGSNVGARLVGTDPQRSDEWIVLSAHYDHLGIRAGRLYPGADDNASGVAMMLEVARALREAPERPRRSVMFVAFDLEETGLLGSRYFVAHPPVPLEQIKLFVTADMIGRALGGVCRSSVFVMGTEHAPALRPWLERTANGAPLTLGMIGSDILVVNRSDYGPFRARKIPYLFFSTGENPCYHSPEDKPETIDYPKLTAISRLILGVVRETVMADRLPGWSSVPDHPLAEAVAIREVFRTFLEHRGELKVAPAQALLMTNALRSLDAIVARGSITPAERVGVVNVARVILLSLF